MQTGLSAQLAVVGLRPRERRARGQLRDRRRRAGRRCAGRSCSWLCGTAASGDVAIDLSGLARRRRTPSASTRRRTPTDGAGAGPFAFTVDRTAPAQPQIHVVPDPAATRAGWWGHAPIALSLSTGTAADVVSSTAARLRPRRGRSCSTRPPPARSPRPSIPAAALGATGALRRRRRRVRRARATARPRRARSCAGTATPPPVPADALGAAARLARRARRRAPDLAALRPRVRAAAASPGRSSASARRPLPRARRPLRRHRAGRRVPRAPSETRDRRRRSIHGAAAGLPRDPPDLGRRASRRARPGVRCALVDELAPGGDDERRAGLERRRADRRARRERRRRRGVLAGAARRRARRPRRRGGHDRRRGLARPARRRARRRGQRDRRRAGARRRREPAVDRRRHGRLRRARDARRRRPTRSRASRSSRCAWAARRSRRGSRPTGARRSRACRPACALDGAAVAVRVLDASSPANASERSATLPVRSLPVLRGLSAAREPRHRPPGAPEPVPACGCWAYPKGREPHVVGTYAARADGTLRRARAPAPHDALRRRGPARRQQFRALAERDGRHACA